MKTKIAAAYNMKRSAVRITGSKPHEEFSREPGQEGLSVHE
jgi:hypothetical protein